jgi:hypothetical protein
MGAPYIYDISHLRVNGRRLELQKQLEEEDYIIVKWTQEDVETLYSLLNK